MFHDALITDAHDDLSVYRDQHYELDFGAREFGKIQVGWQIVLLPGILFFFLDVFFLQACFSSLDLSQPFKPIGSVWIVWFGLQYQRSQLEHNQMEILNQIPTDTERLVKIITLLWKAICRLSKETLRSETSFGSTGPPISSYRSSRHFKVTLWVAWSRGSTITQA